MNKLATPLEALEELKKQTGSMPYICFENGLGHRTTFLIKDTALFPIIETALKRLEKIETTTHSVLRDDISKKLKALEIIKETPEFAWYVKIYDNAYEMVTDVKGFRVNNSVEELQEMFDLLKEVLF